MALFSKDIQTEGNNRRQKAIIPHHSNYNHFVAIVPNDLEEEEEVDLDAVSLTGSLDSIDEVLFETDDEDEDNNTADTNQHKERSSRSRNKDWDNRVREGHRQRQQQSCDRRSSPSQKSPKSTNQNEDESESERESDRSDSDRSEPIPEGLLLFKCFSFYQI